MDARIDNVVVRKILDNVKERIKFYLSDVRDHMDEIGRLIFVGYVDVVDFFLNIQDFFFKQK